MQSNPTVRSPHLDHRGWWTRPTLGVICPDITETYQNTIWTGVAGAAAEYDANLITYVGEGLETPLAYRAQRNIAYELIDSRLVQGLIVFSGSLGLVVGAEGVERFITSHFGSIPTVSLGMELRNVPSFLVDNYQGMYAVVAHLIQVHARRKFAFVRGPAGHPEAEERYRAFANALDDNGIELNEKYVMPGLFQREAGIVAVHRLFEGLHADVDAIVGVDDVTALGVLDALQELNISVPGDVAVAGFDDVSETRFSKPPLTTVRQPLLQQGRQSVEAVLAMLEGDPVPERVLSPAILQVRRSCGCLSDQVEEAGEQTPILVDVERGPFLEGTAYGDLPETLLEIVTVPGVGADLSMDWVEGLLDALVTYLHGASTDVFTRYLDDLLVGDVGSRENVAVWNTFISALRRHMLEILPDGELLARFEHLMQKARVLVAETMQRTQAYETLQAQQRIVQINEVSEGLATIFHMDELMQVTANYLPELGIRQSYLALYEDPEAPTEAVRLIMAHNEHGRIKVPESAARFDPKKLLPDAISWPSRRYNLVVEALFLRDQQLGMAVFESDQRDGVIYEILRRQLNSAIAAALVFQEREASGRALEAANRDLERYADTLERRTVQLQVASEVAREAAAIQELQPLLDRTVELVSERFGFYHVGLFLIDDAGEFAVLQAASSEGGRRLLQRGYKLAVGETGIVGYVAGEGEARIVLDVGADATFFDNPDLAATRSAMALPLRLRGVVTGVLDVQSQQPRAFQGEDLEIMQVLADQLGLAIDNARLLSESQQAIAELEAASGEYARKSWFGRGRGAALAYDGVGVRSVDAAEVPGLGDALRRGDVVTAKDADDGRSTVTVPLYVRDQIIGAVALEERTASREWSDEQLQVVQDLAGQIGQSLETARLLEETQSRAQRERLIREISSQMRETLDIQTVLRTIADELYGALDLEEVVVQLVANPTVDEQTELE